jgi:hypothetical protein
MDRRDFLLTSSFLPLMTLLDQNILFDGVNVL